MKASGHQDHSIPPDELPGWNDDISEELEHSLVRERGFSFSNYPFDNELSNHRCLFFVTAKIAKSLLRKLFHALHMSTNLEITSHRKAEKRISSSCNDPAEYTDLIVTMILPFNTSSNSLPAILRAGMHGRNGL